MKFKTILAAIAAVSIGVVSTYAFFETKVQSKIKDVELEAATTKDELLGYTKYTDYIASGKQKLTEQSKFLAAKVVRDYELVEHINKTILTVPLDATISVNYNVEYSFGYDLKPESFEMRSTADGIEVKLGKPVLVASPAILSMTHSIIQANVLTDPHLAIIQVQQRLPGIAHTKGVAMERDEAVRALCEKKLVEFLRDFMGKQGVKHLPNIAVVYK